jgi:hypothetical protein
MRELAFARTTLAPDQRDVAYRELALREALNYSQCRVLGVELGEDRTVAISDQQVGHPSVHAARMPGASIEANIDIGMWRVPAAMHQGEGRLTAPKFCVADRRLGELVTNSEKYPTEPRGPKNG